ncbi:MAG: ABC transporter ATP-binding protein [Chloroflexota bacterium]
MNAIAIWLRMMSYLWPYRGRAILAFAGTIGSTMLMIAIPTILRDVIDIGIIGTMPLIDATPPLIVAYIEEFEFEYGNATFMLVAGMLVIGLGLLRGITGFVFRYFGESLSHNIAYDIRNQVYQKVQSQSFTYHDQAQTGTLITLAISDVDEMQRYFAFGLIDTVNTTLLVVGIALIMFISSPLLAAITLIPLIPLAYFSRNFAHSVDPLWKQIMERLQKLGNHIQENSVGAEVVRAFNREDYEIKKFNYNNEQLYHERLNLIGKWATYLPLSSFVIAFSTALVLFFGGLMERNEATGVTVGLVVSFNAYVLLVAQPIRFLGFVILLMTQAVSSARRVFRVLDEPEIVTDKPQPVVLDEVRGHVRMENVMFRFDGVDHDVLKSISFEAVPGTVTAIIGPTGSGKSALVSLIPRFYDVTSGRVTVDGVDVRDLKLNNLRDNIGIVLQTTLLFSATIRENISYGNPDASEDEVIAAAKAANAHDFIMEFPDGYDTLVGERGVTLSGGQKQRIAIARALIINPRILILDDSTSSVDTKTEFMIQEALKRVMHGRTTFIIAQRLSSVQQADQILVLQDGEIVERGKHEELLEAGGHYAEIYQLQLADQDRVRRELESLGRLPKDADLLGEDKRLATDEIRAIIGDYREVSGD